MHVVCINTDRDINYFLHSFNVNCEHWNDEDAKFNFRLAQRTENQKKIIIVDYDCSKWIATVTIPTNWYVIALTSDAMLKNDKMTIINKGASSENILNVIQDILDETCYTQLGVFPLYLGVTRMEIATHNGVMMLGKKEWRILNYLNKNKGRRVSGEELKYHVLDVGDEEDLVEGGKNLVRVLVAKLRKKFSLMISSPVISFGCKNSGYYLLDYFNEDWEYLINRNRNTAFVVIDDEFKQPLQDIYEKLKQEVAEKSIYEIRHNLRLTSHTKRYNFLKNNLTFKEFTLSRLVTLLKSVRFPKRKKLLKKAETEGLAELEYQK